MKKKLIITIVFISLALGGAAALAVAASMQDPLISLDYLGGAYRQELMKQTGTKADSANAQSYTAAEKRLDEATARLRTQLSKAGTMASDTHYAQFTQQTRRFGDTVTITAGSGFLFLEGRAEAKLSGGELIDVTQGTASTGMSLQPGRRYLVGEGATAAITITSEAAYIAPVGNATHKQSGTAALPFVDLARADWFYQAVSYVVEKKLFNGIDERHFAPQSSVTRGMLTTVLYRLAGSPKIAQDAPRFLDVPAGQWYENGVRWAASVGVVNGMSAERFAPDSSITREQLATMLYRYAAQYAKLDTSKADDLTKFTDKASASSWAQEGLSWVVAAGIIGGDTQGNLKPLAFASRAETATMIERFAKLLP